MLLFHVTRSHNLLSIHDQGLQPDLATGKRQVIWLCDAARLLWAVPHVCRHHGLSENQVSVLSVVVPRSWLTRCGRPGVFWCAFAIPSCQLAIVEKRYLLSC